MYLYFLLVCFSSIQVSWCYFVSNTIATWTEQIAECKMATPSIQHEGLEFNVTMDQPLPNIGVWVGYYEKLRAFDYIGCIKPGNVQLIPTAIELGVPTPGRCYSACAYTQYIGIKKRECYCLETKPDGKTTEQGCDNRCNDLSQTVCGGNDHISLYRISTNDMNFIQKRGEEKCLRINFQDEEKYKWINCQWKMWASCTSVSKQWVHIWKQGKSWNGAAKLCFNKGMYPTRLEDIRHVINGSFYSWTGVVRSDVIYKNTELGTISSDIVYGYLIHEESVGYVLKFSQADVRKHILCEGSWQRENQGSRGSDVTVVVSVSVSVAMLIAAVIVISILKRRKKTLSICKRKPTTREPGKRDSNSTVNQTSHNNRSYEHEFKDDTDRCDDSSYAHSYHVLEQHVKDSNIDKTTHDISGAERKTTDMENDNIYNKLKPENNVTYDHAYNITKNGSQISDVTYDTSGKTAMKPMASSVEYLDEFDDNAYNHIPIDKLQKIKTDNVYCSHGQQGVGEGHEDKEDTYSHINNTIKGSNKHDNLYNKINSSNLEESSEGKYDATNEHSGSQNVDNEYSVIGTMH